jgi:hypothetical protein
LRNEKLRLEFDCLAVMAVDPMLQRANGAQAGIRRLHDQALVGAACPAVGLAKEEAFACWHPAFAEATARQVRLLLVESGRKLPHSRKGAMAGWHSKGKMPLLTELKELLI